MTTAGLWLAGLWLWSAPESAPLGVAAGLAIAVGPLIRAYRAAEGTALRAAIVWAGLGLGLGVVGQLAGFAEPVSEGRPIAGHLSYLAVLCLLASLVSVLGARTPGGGAWAILMALLLVVFLIPWLEGPGLGRGRWGIGHLRLYNPWSLFYGLLVLAGITNYLPTRFGVGASWVGAAFMVEYLGLSEVDWPLPTRAWIWSVAPWLASVGVVIAARAGERPIAASTRLEAAWLWFRDHWGVVWALRVLERFNRTAELQNWPFRLAWIGLVWGEGETKTDAPIAAAEATLTTLLRRFARPDRVARAVESGLGGPCSEASDSR